MRKSCSASLKGGGRRTIKIHQYWELAAVAKQEITPSELLRPRATRRCAVLTHG
jgi:hypothetical protein